MINFLVTDNHYPWWKLLSITNKHNRCHNLIFGMPVIAEINWIILPRVISSEFNASSRFRSKTLNYIYKPANSFSPLVKRLPLPSCNAKYRKLLSFDKKYVISVQVNKFDVTLMKIQLFRLPYHAIMPTCACARLKSVTNIVCVIYPA